MALNYISLISLAYNRQPFAVKRIHAFKRSSQRGIRYPSP